MATITAKIGYYQRGDWSATTSYDILDVVRAAYGTRYATYSSKTSGNKGNTPSADSEYWEVLSIDGETATSYRLTADSQVYKTSTTSVAIGVTKSEGGEVTVLSTLPTGWKIGVHCESGDSYSDNYYSAPTSIDPHAWETVAVTLYDGDPQSSTSAQAVDIVTLRLVSDGTDGAKGDKGDKGDTGAQGEKGDKGDSGDVANSLILQPYNDYECYNVTAMDYETGIVTVDTPLDDLVSVGDYVAVVFNTAKAGGNYFAPLANPSKYTFYHYGAKSASFLYAQVTAVDGKTVTVSAYINTGKGTLANPTDYMLVHYGSSAPSRALLELPTGYIGKPLRVEMVGQSIGKAAGNWNNWNLEFFTSASKSLVATGGDRGHGTVVHDQVDLLDGWVVSRDLANIYGVDTSGNYRQKEFPIKRSFDLTQCAKVNVPYQFAVPYNYIIISLL